MTRPPRSEVYREAFAAEDTDRLKRQQNRRACIVAVRSVMQEMPVETQAAMLAAALDNSLGHTCRAYWNNATEQDAFEILTLLLKP